MFVRREEAIVYHTYHKALAGTPQHSYYLLLKIIKSWSFYTKKLKEDKQTEQFRVSSLMFRRASLLSRALYDWSDAVKMIKLKRLREKKRGKIVFRLCFSSWKDSVNHVKNDCIHHYNNYCSNLLSRVWRYWKKYHVKTSVEMPSEYYSFLIRRKFFKFWRTIKARIIIRKDILPILSKTMLRSAFAEWSSLLQRTRRYRQGMKLLESLYYKCKMIVAFRQWPGRRQWQLSEELKQNYDTRGRGKIRLVDYDHAEEKEKKSALSKEYRKKSIEESNRSYLLSKRNNLEQRALKHGFINDLNDRFQVGNIRELGLAVLTAWKKASAYKRNLHYKQWKVRALINSKTELLALRHWMAVTPMTTYRVVTWMSKRYRRAHDLYLYDKALTVRPLLPGDEEYEEEMKNQLDYEALYKAGRDRFQQKRYGGSTFLDKAVAVIEHYSDEN